jgi:hypothetical protein
VPHCKVSGCEKAREKHKFIATKNQKEKKNGVVSLSHVISFLSFALVIIKNLKTTYIADKKMASRR